MLLEGCVIVVVAKTFHLGLLLFGAPKKTSKILAKLHSAVGPMPPPVNGLQGDKAD